MNGNLILAVLVFLPFLGGLLAWAVGRSSEGIRDYLADAVTILECVLMIWLLLTCGREGVVLNLHMADICGMGLTFTMDGFRLIYGTIASLMWMMTTILSREYFRHHRNRNRFYLFLLWTLGATMGVFLSADLFTTFVFFEIMSFTSYVWVAQEEDAPSLRAAETYLGVAVIGGLVLLMGLFLVYQQLGTLEIAGLLEAVKGYPDRGLLYTAGVCMLIGFGAKAGAFPLHIWLPKAHPVAPAPASALLSGILTKTGIFGILVISANLFLHDSSWGALLLAVGVLTMFGGALLAVFSIDLKRTLACSSMSQIGFILLGIGMQGLLGEENALAVHGTFLHMVNHSLIKLVLFMAAGVIFMNAHALDLNEIRGFGKRKPLLKGIFLVGALAIGGIPMFGGYISKTLLHESIVEYGGSWLMRGVESIFLFSGGLTVAYMTKLYAAIFLEENENPQVQKNYDGMKKYMNGESGAALGVSALLLLVWGLLPHQVMERAAHLGQGLMHLEDFGHEVAYFSLTNLKGAVISIVIGGLVYGLVIRKLLMKEKRYINPWPKWLDLEELIYRPVLLGFLPFISRLLCRVFDSLPDGIVVLLRRTIYRDSPLPYELPEGNGVTLALGRGMNFFQRKKNRIRRQEGLPEKDYVHILAMKNETIRESNRIIQRSLSFGLLLFCIGLCLTLIYIILM